MIHKRAEIGLGTILILRQHISGFFQNNKTKLRILKPKNEIKQNKYVWPLSTSTV